MCHALCSFHFHLPLNLPKIGMYVCVCDSVGSVLSSGGYFFMEEPEERRERDEDLKSFISIELL